jgi:phage terminase small subunit
MANGFTFKQKRFIELYDGNATKAAVEAGYSPKTAYCIAHENLKKPEIIKAIQERGMEERMTKIASRQERQSFWSEVMDNEELDMMVRLRASELLGKSEADFKEKLEVNGDIKHIPMVEQFDLDQRIAQLRESNAKDEGIKKLSERVEVQAEDL